MDWLKYKREGNGKLPTTNVKLYHEKLTTSEFFWWICSGRSYSRWQDIIAFVQSLDISFLGQSYSVHQTNAEVLIPAIFSDRERLWLFIGVATFPEWEYTRTANACTKHSWHEWNPENFFAFFLFLHGQKRQSFEPKSSSANISSYYYIPLIVAY